MTDQHPITPPPELVRQWIPAGWDCSPNTFTTLLMRIADKAALWSHDHCKSKIKAATDQELEACCEWLSFYSAASDARDLRIARRPNPPSLKEQALKALTAIEGDFNTVGDRADTIRRALEALDD
jgi:hypothetical protein